MFFDIDVTRNGNNLKLKVTSEFSLSMGLMVINHSTTVLCDNYIFQAVRTSCRKCSKCFYVYLNIRPMRYSAMQIIIIEQT